MKCSRLKGDKNIKENIIKDVRIFFRLKKLQKETNDTTIEGIRNLFKLKSKKNKNKKKVKCRILRKIRNLSEHKEENYYKLVGLGNFWSNIYIEYKSKGNRTLSVKKYLNKIRLYLKKYHK